MIQLTPQMRILVAVEPQDFRRGIDGMAEVCKANLASDPFSGTAYVFRSRRSSFVDITPHRANVARDRPGWVAGTE